MNKRKYRRLRRVVLSNGYRDMRVERMQAMAFRCVSELESARWYNRMAWYMDRPPAYWQNLELLKKTREAGDGE